MNSLPADIALGTLPHILVIDDDDRIRQLVARYLNENGFLALQADSALAAETLLRVGVFDALVVDVMMPEKSGLEFMKDLRTYSSVPVIMLTALGEIGDKISGFEAGVDDYLPKPFDPKELVMRLQAILRRRPVSRVRDEDIRIGPWTFNPQQNELSDEEDTVKLTDVEGTLLKALLSRQNEIISREGLAKLCGVDAGERTIDVQITRLRRKIEIDSKNPRLLQTVRGKGYILRTGEN